MYCLLVNIDASMDDTVIGVHHLYRQDDWATLESDSNFFCRALDL